jgi:DNA-binding NtrC family response regulator
VIPIELPRYGRDWKDVAELTSHFISKFCAQSGRLSELARARCGCWKTIPGRETCGKLEHTIERAVALETTDTIIPKRLPEKITSYNPHRIADAFDFPEEGLNLTAYLDLLEKDLPARGASKIPAAIRPTPPHCCSSLYGR